jgi:hypothetical protein
MASNYVNFSKFKFNKPIDDFRIGHIYDYVFHDNKNATKYYKKALKKIKKKRDPDGEFIKTKLRDRQILNQVAEIDDNIIWLDLNDFVPDDDPQQNIIKPADNVNIPEIKTYWVSDSQNVHDTNINNELKSQYDLITNYNITNNIYIYSYNDIMAYLLNIYPTECNEMDKNNIEPAISMLEYIQKHNGNIMKLDTNETYFIQQVFSKIMAADNMRITMLENFVLNLKQSWNENIPVCITGRTTRILSSFAFCDAGIGILKSKQVIKNEIFAKAGTIQNKIINDYPPNIQEKYNNGDDDMKYIDCRINEEIKKMVYNDYADSVDGDFLSDVLQEIHSY